MKCREKVQILNKNFQESRENKLILLDNEESSFEGELSEQTERLHETVPASKSIWQNYMKKEENRSQEKAKKSVTSEYQKSNRLIPKSG